LATGQQSKANQEQTKTKIDKHARGSKTGQPKQKQQHTTTTTNNKTKQIDHAPQEKPLQS